MAAAARPNAQGARAPRGFGGAQGRPHHSVQRDNWLRGSLQAAALQTELAETHRQLGVATRARAPLTVQSEVERLRAQLEAEAEGGRQAAAKLVAVTRQHQRSEERPRAAGGSSGHARRVFRRLPLAAHAVGLWAAVYLFVVVVVPCDPFLLPPRPPSTLSLGRPNPLLPFPPPAAPCLHSSPPRLFRLGSSPSPPDEPRPFPPAPLTPGT